MWMYGKTMKDRNLRKNNFFHFVSKRCLHTCIAHTRRGINEHGATNSIRVTVIKSILSTIQKVNIKSTLLLPSDMPACQIIGH